MTFNPESLLYLIPMAAGGLVFWIFGRRYTKPPKPRPLPDGWAQRQARERERPRA